MSDKDFLAELSQKYNTPIVESKKLKIATSQTPKEITQQKPSPEQLKEQLKSLPYEARLSLRKNAFVDQSGSFTLPSINDPMLGAYEGLQFTDAEWKRDYSSVYGNATIGPSTGKETRIELPGQTAPEDTYSADFVKYVEDARLTKERTAMQNQAWERAGYDYIDRLALSRMPATRQNDFADFSLTNPLTYLNPLFEVGANYQSAFVGAGYDAIRGVAGGMESWGGNDPYFAFAKQAVQRFADDMMVRRNVDYMTKPVTETRSFLEGGFADPNYYAKTVGSVVPHVIGALGSSVMGTLATGGNAIGGIAAATSYGIAVETGSMYNDLLDAGVGLDDARFGSQVYGAIAGSLEAFNPGGIGSKIGAKILGTNAQRIISEHAKAITKNALVRGGLTMIKEGGTEAAQEFANNVVMNYYDSSRGYWDNLPDAFIGGLIGGAVFGAVDVAVDGDVGSEGNVDPNYRGTPRQEMPTQDAPVQETPAAPTPDMSVSELETTIDSLLEEAKAERAAMQMGTVVLEQEGNIPAIQEIMQDAKTRLDEINVSSKLFLEETARRNAEFLVQTDNVNIQIGTTPDGKFIASGDVTMDGQSFSLNFDADLSSDLRGEAIASVVNRMNVWVADRLAEDGIRNQAEVDAVFDTLTNIQENMMNPEAFVQENREAVLTAQDSTTVEDFQQTMTEEKLDIGKDRSLEDFFKRATNADSIYLTKKEATQVVDNLVGDLGIEAKWVGQVSNNPKALGRFVQDIATPMGWIEMREGGNATQTGERNIKMSTPYHEVAHAYFRNLVDSKTQAEILDEVRGEHKNENLTDLEAEEILAEDLKNFVLKKKKRESKYGKLLAKLIDYGERILNWVGVFPFDKTEQFYRDVLAKKRPSERKKIELENQRREFLQVQQQYFQAPHELTSKFFKHKEIAGKEFVGYQQAKNALKGAGLKKAELDIIEAVLDSQFKDQKRIPVSDLENAIVGELVPLEVKDSSKYADYGADRVGMEDWDTVTHIYDGPIEHGIEGHFEGETTKLFGHTRMATDGKTRAMMEVQSDFFQKIRDGFRYISKAEKDATRDGYKARSNVIIIESILDSIYPDIALSAKGVDGMFQFPLMDGISRQGRELLFDIFPSTSSLENFMSGTGIENAKSFVSIVEGILAQKKSEAEKLEVVENLERERSLARQNEIEKTLFPYANIWHERMIREEIRLAAMDGMESFRVPDAFTLAKIEQYEGTGGSPYEVTYTNGGGDVLDAGDIIDYGGEELMVIKSDPYGGIEVVDRNSVNEVRIDEMLAEEAQNRAAEIMDEVEALADGEEVVYGDINYGDILEKYVAKNEVDPREVDVTDLASFIEEQGTWMGEVTESLEEVYEKVIEEGDFYYLVDFGVHTETFSQPKDYQSSAEDFDPAELPDEQLAVYNFYKRKVTPYFEKLRKGNAEKITDENGNTWYETKITKDDLQAVEAFQTDESMEAPSKEIDIVTPLKDFDIKEIEAFQEEDFEIPTASGVLSGKKITGYKQFPQDEQVRYMAVAKKLVAVSNDVEQSSEVEAGNDALRILSTAYKYDQYLLTKYGVGLDEVTLGVVSRLEESAEKILMVQVQSREFDVIPYAEQLSTAREILDHASNIARMVKRSTSRLGSTIEEVMSNGYADIETMVSEAMRTQNLTESERESAQFFTNLDSDFGNEYLSEEQRQAYLDGIMEMAVSAIDKSTIRRSRLQDDASKFEDYSVKVSKERTQAEATRRKLTKLRQEAAERREALAQTRAERGVKRRIHEQLMKRDAPTIEMTMREMYQDRAKAAEEAAKETKRRVQQEYKMAKQRKDMMEKIQKTRTRMKDRIKKGKFVDVEYAKQLIELFDTFEKSRPSQRTIEAMNRIFEMQKRGELASVGQPNADGKVHTQEEADAMIAYAENAQKRLNRVPLSDMSVDEMAFLYDEIARIIEAGRVKLQLKKYLSDADRLVRIEEVTAGTVNISESMVLNMLRQAGEGVENFSENTKANAMEFFSAQSNVDMMDGDQWGRGVNSGLNRQLADAEIAFNAEESKLRDRLGAELKEIGMLRDFDQEQQAFLTLVAREREGESVEFVVEQVVNMYFDGVYPDSVPGITRTQAEAFVDTLLSVREEFDITNRQAGLYEARENKIFPRIDNYVAPSKFTKKTTPDAFATMEEEGISTMTQTFGRDGVGVSNKFALKRQATRSSLKPRVDLVNMYMEGVSHALWYVHLQPEIDSVMDVVGSQQYEQAAGRLATNWWKTQLSLTAQRGYRQGAPKVDLVDGLRMNVTIGILSAKLTTILMQVSQPITASITALPMYGAKASARILLESTKALMPNYVKAVSQVSDAVISRSGTAGLYDVADLQRVMRRDPASKVGRVLEMRNQVAKVGLSAMQYLDTSFYAASRQGVYKALIAEGKSEAEASRAADYFAEFANSSTLVTNRPHVFSRGSGMKLLLMLQSFSMGWMSLMGTIARSTVKSGVSKQGAMGVAALAGAPLLQSMWGDLVYQLLSGRDESDEEIIDRIWKEYAYNIPLFGGIARGFLEYGRDPQINSAALSTVFDMVKDTYMIFTASNEKSSYKAGIRAAEGFAKAAGIPFTAQGFDFIAPLIEHEDDRLKRVQSQVGKTLDISTVSEKDVDSKVREVLAKTYGSTLSEIPSEERDKLESSIRRAVVKAGAKASSNQYISDIGGMSKNADKAALLVEASRNMSNDAFTSMVSQLRKLKILSDAGYKEYLKLKAGS